MKKLILGLALAGMMMPAGLWAQESAAQAARTEENPLWLRYPAISPDGTQIAFCYMGDIFIVPVSGGEARQLTSNPAYDYMPVWSPDGSKIAFASDREGSLDLYYVGVKGGNPVRLTTNSGTETPLAFTLDGQSVLFKSGLMPTVNSMLFPDGTYPQVYKVGLDASRPELFSAYPMDELSLNPDGSILFQDIKGYEDTWRKHHTSSVTRDIWMLKDGKYTKMTTFKGEDRTPVWTPDYKAYYLLSEENGSFNVYKRGLSPNSASEQLTRFQTHPVRFLSVSKDGMLCFTYNGEIYTMRPGAEPLKLDVEIIADNGIKEVTKRVMRSGASELAVSPKQKEVAFILGGDVYVTSMDYATTKRITNTPETERYIDFAPDGRSLVYASERDGVWQVYQASLADKDEDMFTYATDIKEENLTKSQETSFYPQYSPDGKEVAFLKNRTEICVLNLKSGKVRTVMDGKYEYSYQDGDQEYSWSPDSKWILTGYIGTGGWNHKDQALVKADGSGEIHNLTNSGYTEYGGKFVLGGKAMLFQSDRSGYRSHGSWGAETDVYIMFFDQKAYEKFLMDKEERELLAAAEKDSKEAKKEEKAEEKAKKDSADGKEPKVEPLEFDFDYLDDRTLRLTNVSDNLGDMLLSPDGDKLYYMAPYNGKMALWVKDLVEEKTELKVPNVGYGSMEMDKDGANIYFLGMGGIKKISTASGSMENIDFEALYEVRPFAQREYLFSHIWKQVKDKFYMAYTANEQIAIASADSPLGPFRQDELKPVSDVCKQIDPYVFFDEDGKIYLYHVRLLEGNRLFVTEINDTFDALDESTLTECVASEPGTWEDTWNAEWRVAEGPTILKDGGQYYFFYSSNDFRNPDYAVGYAVADSPRGPWVKYAGNPIIDRHKLGFNGTGHGDVFYGPDGGMYYVLHTHQSDSVVSPRRTAVVRMEKADGAFRVLPETLRFLER